MKKKEAYYFSHDSNSRNDLKCIHLRREMGLEGYGIFWCIIEILRETEGHSLEKSSIVHLSYGLNIEPGAVERVINDYGLFRFRGSKFYSPRLSLSMKKYSETKQSLSDAGRRGNAIRWGSGGDATVIAIKGKERKGNKGGASPTGESAGMVW